MKNLHTDHESTGPVAGIAARAMLLILRASVAGGRETRSYRIHPGSGTLLTHGSAVAALSDLPKPVEFEVEVKHDIMVLRWRRALQFSPDASLTDLDAHTFSALNRVPEGGSILLIGGEDSLIVPTQAIRELVAAYRMQSPYSMATNPPDGAQESVGIVSVVEIFEGGEILDFDEYHRLFLADSVDDLQEGSRESQEDETS